MVLRRTWKHLEAVLEKSADQEQRVLAFEAKNKGKAKKAKCQPPSSSSYSKPIPEVQVQVVEQVVHVPEVIMQERTQQVPVEPAVEVPVPVVQRKSVRVPKIIQQASSASASAALVASPEESKKTAPASTRYVRREYKPHWVKKSSSLLAIVTGDIPAIECLPSRGELLCYGQNGG